jgi:D-serine deaminase-like pyridoxal phosphate-dependent protein
LLRELLAQPCVLVLPDQRLSPSGRRRLVPRPAGRRPVWDHRLVAASPAELYARYEAATAALDPPFALVDMDALWWNAADMLRRAEGTRLRVASKSVRCRPLLRMILERDPGYRGLMTFTLPETLWLHEHGFEDLLVAYPTADRAAMRELGRLEGPDRPVVMIDSTDHLDLIDAACGAARSPIRVCIEMDLSYPLARGRLRIGPKRSALRTPDEVVAVARDVVGRPGFELVGLMGYEGHIAGLGDDPGPRLKGAVIRRLQAASARELAERRGSIVEAVRRVAPVELVNGGGTGSVHTTAREPCITEVTVGSGFYAPGLFDHYRAFTLRPAAMFALPVVRRPDPGVATLLGGGYPASGPAGKDRLPKLYLPAGLKLDSFEGTGEVQTPVSGEAAKRLRVEDRVYLRHAKAGELCERFDRLYLLEHDRIVDEVPTYRGDGKSFL